MRDVFVTNKNDFHHSDRWDGEDFDFPPGERVQVPVEAAVHMFGLGLEDKTDVLVRLGWNTKYNRETKAIEDDSTAGVKKLARFVFTQGVLVEAPVDSPAQLAA